MLNLSYDIFFEDLSSFIDHVGNFKGNLFDHILIEGEEILEAGKRAAQTRIGELGRMDTGAMYNSIKPTYRIGDTYIELGLESEVFNNPKNMGYNYVPDQEYRGFNIMVMKEKEPVNMMFHAMGEMEGMVDDLLDDIVLTVWNGSFVGNNKNGVPF